MQPVYIQRIASIHPQGNHSQGNNPKVNDSPDVSANRPFLQACEPDYKDIIALVLRSFQEGTDYSDGTDILALIEEIRDSAYHIPELSFVAEENGKIVGHFMFSRFPLSPTAEGGHGPAREAETVLLAPVSVHAEHFRQGIGKTMLSLGIDRARESGYKGTILEGDYHYYNRLGFKTSV